MAKATNKKSSTKTKTATKRPLVRTVDQLTFARLIAQKFELPINTVLEIILEEQKLTMRFVNDGYKVVKKNYLTLESRLFEGKAWVSPLDKKTYQTKDRKRVLIRVGEGFKSYINGEKKKDDKLCRFVATKEEEKNLGSFIEVS